MEDMKSEITDLRNSKSSFKEQNTDNFFFTADDSKHSFTLESLKNENEMLKTKLKRIEEL
jgi:hypothetical protein